MRVLRATSVVYIAASVGFLILSIATDGRPGLWPFLVAMSMVLSMHAMLIPNAKSRAMDPMGAIAGTAAAVIAAITGALGGFLGALIDGFYNGTVTPLAVGFVASSISAALLILWAERTASAPRSS